MLPHSGRGGLPSLPQHVTAHGTQKETVQVRLSRHLHYRSPAYRITCSKTHSIHVASSMQYMYPRYSAITWKGAKGAVQQVLEGCEMYIATSTKYSSHLWLTGMQDNTTWDGTTMTWSCAPLQSW
jgi:hypothetical protein